MGYNKIQSSRTSVGKSLPYPKLLQTRTVLSEIIAFPIGRTEYRLDCSLVEHLGQPLSRCAVRTLTSLAGTRTLADEVTASS